MEKNNIALFEELVTKQMSGANIPMLVSLYNKFNDYILVEYTAYSIDLDTRTALTKSLNRIFTYFVKQWEVAENENNYQE